MYTYKDHEIYARVYNSHSELWEINNRGRITDEVDGCRFDHDDRSIVWYEVEAVEPKTGYTTIFVRLETLEDAKKTVDESIKYMKSLNLK